MNLGTSYEQAETKSTYQIVNFVVPTECDVRSFVFGSIDVSSWFFTPKSQQRPQVQR